MKRLLAPKADDGSAMGRMIGAAQEALAKRFQSQAEQKEDVLGSLIKRGLTLVEVENESLLQVMAGVDSTATAIRMIMYFIMTNPRVYMKLQGELDEGDRKKTLSWLVLSDAEARSLPYLQAVIKSLRTWSPGVGIATKWSAPEGDTLEDGRFIPGGRGVAWSAWGVQHNNEIYGMMPNISDLRGGSN